MSEIEDRLRSIQTRHSQATAVLARSEVELEHAGERRNEAKQKLLDEFGVSTSDDLRRVREELNSEVEKQLALAEEALSSAGSGTA